MKSRWKPALPFGCALIAAAGGSALAQNPPPATRTPLYDPQQLPMQRGEVQQFTLTPRGDIDGLILTDGTEVKTPPHLSTEIANSVKPGDTVTIHGLRAARCPWCKPCPSLTSRPDGRSSTTARRVRDVQARHPRSRHGRA